LRQVLEHATGSTHDDVHARKSVLFFLQTLSTNDQTSREQMTLSSDLDQDVENLYGEFTGRGDDHGTQTSILTDALLAVQVLEDGDDEGQSLSRTSFGGTQDVGAMEGERNGACLNRREGGEVAGFQTFLGRQREW
jgi:hypothetical protein